MEVTVHNVVDVCVVQGVGDGREDALDFIGWDMLSWDDTLSNAAPGGILGDQIGAIRFMQVLPLHWQKAEILYFDDIAVFELFELFGAS